MGDPSGSQSFQDYSAGESSEVAWRAVHVFSPYLGLSCFCRLISLMNHHGILRMLILFYLGLTPDRALEKTSFSCSLLSNHAVLWGIILTKISFLTPPHRRQNDCTYTGHLKKQVWYTQNKLWKKWPSRENFKMLTVLFSSMYLTFDNEYLIMEYLFIERYKAHC